MSTRTTAVLDRFPSHLSLSDPDKRFRRMAEGLVADLDVLSRQIGDVRRAHRLAEAPTVGDVEALGALHAMGANRYALVDARTRSLAAADADDTALLSVLINRPVADLDALDPQLRRDLLAAAVAFPARLQGRREVVRGVIEAHRRGNGTATALLLATATYLGLRPAPAPVAHDAGRWWHTLTVLDTMAGGSIPPGPDLLAVEENPFVEAAISPVERRHGDRFRVRRGGLEDVIASVVVVGRQDRTVGPTVVNIDTGQGLVYDGVVGDGDELVFGAQGPVTLAGAVVTGSAFAFSGGVFADRDETHPNDFVFGREGPGEDPSGDRVATWVVTSPIADGFGPAPALPHGGSVTGLPLALGESRWAAFARVAHLGTDEPARRPAVTRNSAGLFDGSVFSAGPADGPPEPFGGIGFRWAEREPFAVRILLPQRLAAVDDLDGTIIRQPLRALLDRHRAAGIRVSVAYGEPRWDLGRGIARDAASVEPLGTVVVGTTLWPDETPQPAPT